MPLLAKANCPKPTPLVGDTMGELVLKLVELAELYYTCTKSIGIEFKKD